MPPSARGSLSGRRRISSFEKPGRTSPVVARAVHQLQALFDLEAVRPESFPPARGGGAVRDGGGGAAASGASVSNFTETGGTSVAPGQPATTFTRRIGSSLAFGLNRMTTIR